MKINVAVIDDNAFLIKAVLDKLSFFEDIHIKFTAVDGAMACEKIKEENNVQVILMDIEMPKMNGIQATEIIKNLHPQIKIIMLTVLDNDESVFKAIQAGADGYFLKEVDPQTLYDGILQTINGGAAMTPSIAMKTLKLLRNPLVMEREVQLDEVQLTSREVEVLEQLSKGLTYHLIAENLVLSPFTIRKHIENIYRKLQVHSKIEAIQQAKKRNIIE
ncbi:MAG: response regulator transcription factor [Crocinitomicaceae bacterium]|nr:response regulator transcription factor [Crocinitomicaceae bacterium]